MKEIDLTKKINIPVFDNENLIIWENWPTEELIKKAEKEFKIIVAYCHDRSINRDEWIANIAKLPKSHNLCAWLHPYSYEDFKKWFNSNYHYDIDSYWYAPAGYNRGTIND